MIDEEKSFSPSEDEDIPNDQTSDKILDSASDEENNDEEPLEV